ncbi:MAG TPA: DUF4082 domain-containing protein, partial [Acidimicrobiia bacterium]|nr:DUF4082 domain-containing protein [Acidimicrobiia bacterium]
MGLFALAVPVLPAGAATCVSSCTIWNPATQPGAPVLFNDHLGVELAVKFTAEVSGFVTGVRFYKDAGMTGATRTAHLWSADGTLLAQAPFVETASGWQQVNFAAPVAVTANTTYLASYYAPDGQYVQYVANDWWPFPSDNPPLHATGSAYHYGPSGSFPDLTFENANYWADVVFTQGADLSITKTASPDPVLVGSTLTYSLSVSDAGPAGATGVTATDPLPAGVSFVSASASQGSCSQSSGTVTCSLGSLAAGAGATV